MSAELINALHDIVGDAGLKTAEDDTASFLTDWHGQYQGQAIAVVMPDNTEQVSAVMALAEAHDIVVVPQGGNTGFMGGATPDSHGRTILLSLRRMNRIREIDATNMSNRLAAASARSPDGLRQSASLPAPCTLPNPINSMPGLAEVTLTRSAASGA